MGINDFPGSRAPNSNEQKAVFNKERILSDAEALKGGADIDADGSIGFTEKQKSEARREMLSDTDPEFKNQEVLLNTITEVLKVLRLVSIGPLSLSSRESVTKRALQIVQQYEINHEAIEGISDRLREILKSFDELNNTFVGERRTRGIGYSISHDFGEVVRILESRERSIRDKMTNAAKAA